MCDTVPPIPFLSTAVRHSAWALPSSCQRSPLFFPTLPVVVEAVEAPYHPPRSVGRPATGGHRTHLRTSPALARLWATWRPCGARFSGTPSGVLLRRETRAVYPRRSQYVLDHTRRTPRLRLPSTAVVSHRRRLANNIIAKCLSQGMWPVSTDANLSETPTSPSSAPTAARSQSISLLAGCLVAKQKTVIRPPEVLGLGARSRVPPRATHAAPPSRPATVASQRQLAGSQGRRSRSIGMVPFPLPSSTDVNSSVAGTVGDAWGILPSDSY